MGEEHAVWWEYVSVRGVVDEIADPHCEDKTEQYRLWDPISRLPKL